MQGLSNLAAANLSGALAVTGGGSFQGPLICAAASTTQSLTVVAGTQLQGTLAVGGTSAFTGAASFLGGITSAPNKAISGFDFACSNNLTVGNKLLVSSTLPRSVELVNPSTDAGQALQIFLDRTAATSSSNASVTLAPATANLVLATNAKTAVSVSTANQQVSVTANRQGDTFRVFGDGTASTSTELVLDNAAKAAGQIGRLGCDSTGLYLSPGGTAKAVVLTYSGSLLANNGLVVTNSLASDNVSVTGNLTAANANLQSATFGSLNCNSLTASSGSPLTLFGGDSTKTVTVPGSLVASTINGAANTAITLKGSDAQITTVVSGRLCVDTILANTSSGVFVGVPATFASTVTAPTAVLTALQVTAAPNNNALASFDCTSTFPGYKATVGVVPSAGFQLAVDSAPIFTVAPDTKITTFANSVLLNSALTLQGAAILRGSLTVTGSTVLASTVTPQTDANLNLGSGAQRWANLYVSGSLVIPNAPAFTGKLSELTPDSLMLQGQQAINFNGPRGLVIKNTSATASSTADIVFDRTAIGNAQTDGIGMNGDAGGLFLSTNNAQRINIGTGGLVGVGGIAGVSPLTLAASTSAPGFKNNGLYIYNSNTSSTASAPQNAIVTTQVQSQNNTALAYHCFDNTVFSWSLGMRGNDSKLYLAPTNAGPFTGQKLSIDQSGNAVFAGGLQVADGSVTLPAYGFGSDNNNDTGFYHPSEGVIGVAVNGVKAMTWNSDTSISVPGNLSVASNLTTAGFNCNGFGSINTLSVNQSTTMTGGLTVAGVCNFRDSVITSPTTTTSMLRLVGTSASQAEASMAFNRTGTMSVVWNLGVGTFGTADDFCIGGGVGQGECIRIGAQNGFTSMRHSYGTSDRNQKKDIQDCPVGLDFICKTRPVEYSWKEGGDGKTHWGFVAQDVEGIVSTETGIVGEYVSKGETIKSLAYTELIAPLVKAVQELRAEVDGLRLQVQQR